MAIHTYPKVIGKLNVLRFLPMIAIMKNIISIIVNAKSLVTGTHVLNAKRFCGVTCTKNSNYILLPGVKVLNLKTAYN